MAWLHWRRTTFTPWDINQPATELWCQIYGTLSAPTPGLLGAVIARAEAQVVRLALVYALLDGAEAIGQVHLEAALELWIYCEDSAGTWMMYMDNLTTKAQQRFLPAAKVKSLISIHPGSLMGEQTRCMIVPSLTCHAASCPPSPLGDDG